MTPDEIKIVRRAYAKQITAAVQVVDERVETAFAEVPREDFLGPGPWPIFRMRKAYVPTPTIDPVYLYTDDIVGIIPERHINNGQPSLHAILLSQAAPQAGDHIVHVGAGAGYYSAIMANLVAASGKVTAIEFDPELAARAKANLAPYRNVSVVQGDGSSVAFDAADVIYVNAGATRPADIWLDRLNDGGRLVLPLTTDLGFTSSNWSNMHRRGAVFLVTRRGDEFYARWISPVAIFPCEGMRDAESEKSLAAAFESGEQKRVTRLYRTDEVPAEQCWVRGPGWCLAYA
ncbi:protein-L-isoaspartate O-methyltransferase family protein [Microvirga tunisiensis]|uniref:Protein-L-isoaspartate O-methyltransferase n=1 Tax=Microvirga tunisiensis TaxID=2108360 RepID=A0A5N7MM20_9HYPH|nr:rRNA adenine N-6-methyltransferase family protein [Microvirga tunisiensis]MPR09855.1 methyltransferase domain-containing protein [Microvirga tunisiensis]MPR28047.1 methyltransferase domain-containing protein [Microvirga tunisiensis]